MKNPRVYIPLIVAVQLATWSLLLLLLPGSATITMILKISIWGIPVFVILRAIEGVNFTKFLKLDKRPWISLVLISSVFLFLYSLFLNNWTIQFKSISVYFFISAIVVAPIIEEIVFRGFIQQKLSVFFSLWASIGITSIIFTIYHFPIWFSRGNSITLLACLWLFFFNLDWVFPI